MELFMLEYVALGILVFVALTLFYGIIVIHDIPYEIAKHRNHPQQDALHVAGWISLFTLHALWPFLWIWATLYREDRGWGFSQTKDASKDTETAQTIQALTQRIELLEQQCQDKSIEAEAQNTSLYSTSESDGTVVTGKEETK